jgi:hypothetical protein
MHRSKNQSIKIEQLDNKETVNEMQSFLGGEDNEIQSTIHVGDENDMSVALISFAERIQLQREVSAQRMGSFQMDDIKDIQDEFGDDDEIIVINKIIQVSPKRSMELMN